MVKIPIGLDISTEEVLSSFVYFQCDYKNAAEKTQPHIGLPQMSADLVSESFLLYKIRTAESNREWSQLESIGWPRWSGDAVVKILPNMSPVRSHKLRFVNII